MSSKQLNESHSNEQKEKPKKVKQSKSPKQAKKKKKSKSSKLSLEAQYNELFNEHRKLMKKINALHKQNKKQTLKFKTLLALGNCQIALCKSAKKLK